jgi:hypothetical protein
MSRVGSKGTIAPGSLRWFRQELDLWDAAEGSRPMPQPRDFDIDLPNLRPSEVDWGVKGPRLSIARSENRILIYCPVDCGMAAVITAFRALGLWANESNGPKWRRFRYTRELDVIVITDVQT